MDNKQRMRLEAILQQWDGAQVVDEDSENIFVYKTRTSRTHQKPMKTETQLKGNRANLIPERGDGIHYASSLVANKAQTPRATERTGENPTEVQGKKMNVPNQTKRRVGPSPINERSIKVSFGTDEEQPSSTCQSISPRRSPVTYSMQAESPGPISNSFCFERITRRIQSMFHGLLRFKTIAFFQVFLAIYITILTFADIGWPGGLRDTETGLIIDRESPKRTEDGLILVNGTERAIVAATPFQVACIGVARISAWLMYPALVVVFFSKFRATVAFLSTTPFAMYMHSDSHEVHVYCGWNIIVLSAIHSIAHIVRWAEQGNLSLLLYHFSGLTGLFIITSCLLICFPMTIFRERIKYEIRKYMHYLFIVFAVALCFHTPSSAIPNGGFTSWVFGTILLWYFLDYLFCSFFMTEKIDTTKFSVLPSGVRMTMEVSKRFQKMGAHGGICYVCLPWVSKNQWHAFSLFENPSNPAERQIFIQKTGDWTSKVHRILQRDTVRPAWIHGPFPSPYDNAIEYDNQILVASGIGITPALSVIRAHKSSRKINLIWAVRDRHLLDFFLRHMYLDHQGWNLIFYTGKEELISPVIEALSNTNVCIIEGRPRLGEIIPNIIFGVESGLGLPERYSKSTREIASEMLTDHLNFADGAEDLACYASELGFHLPADVIEEDLASTIGSSVISQKRRRRASKSIKEHLAIGFRPWDYHSDASRYVKNLDRKLILSTWGMLYCGGAKPVLADLKNISDEYQIGLHIESFSW